MSGPTVHSYTVIAFSLMGNLFGIIWFLVLSKFRMGNHNLKIETGRHSYPIIPENLRTCDHCETGNIENETHFLFWCKLHNQIRNTLYNNIESRYQNFRKMNTMDTVLFLFNNVDPFACEKVAYFIYESFRIRNAMTKRFITEIYMRFSTFNNPRLYTRPRHIGTLFAARIKIYVLNSSHSVIILTTNQWTLYFWYLER